MPEPLHLDLTDDERTTLEEARRHHPKPYVRERAMALLLIHRGHSARGVTRLGFRSLDTVRRWVHAYRSGGIAGLRVKPGRGRKPSFSPPLRE